MPLSKKGRKVMGSMKKEYGAKKGEKVFYATKNKYPERNADWYMAEYRKSKRKRGK